MSNRNQAIVGQTLKYESKKREKLFNNLEFI
jgi:hypothetical protein